MTTDNNEPVLTETEDQHMQRFYRAALFKLPVDEFADHVACDLANHIVDAGDVSREGIYQRGSSAFLLSIQEAIAELDTLQNYGWRVRMTTVLRFAIGAIQAGWMMLRYDAADQAGLLIYAVVTLRAALANMGDPKAQLEALSKVRPREEVVEEFGGICSRATTRQSKLYHDALAAVVSQRAPVANEATEEPQP